MGVPSGSSLLIQWLSNFLTVTHQKRIYYIVIIHVYIHVLSGKINSWNSVHFCFAWCISHSSLFYWNRKCVSCNPQNWSHDTLLIHSDRKFGNFDIRRGEKWFERKKVPCVAGEMRADPSGWDSGRASWRRWHLSWTLNDGMKPAI